MNNRENKPELAVVLFIILLGFFALFGVYHSMIFIWTFTGYWIVIPAIVLIIFFK